MTPADDSTDLPGAGTPGGDETLAAEYVLGVLDAGERAVVAARIEADAAFAALVEAWEGRLAPLAEQIGEAAPPASLKAALDRRLFGAGERATAMGRLWSSLALWRAVAAAAVVALIVAVALPLATRPPAEVQLAASLAAEASDVRYLALYDADTGRVGLSHLAGERAAGSDFELWVIEGGNAPVSMGVIPVGQSVHLEVAGTIVERLGRDAVLAISLEPAGGSPTGQPTGPVVASGEIRPI